MKFATGFASLAMMVFAAGPVVAGGGHSPQVHRPQHSAPQATAPAGMPSFYQPSRSIDTKEWWLPHPYFQSNGQGFGYPVRPVARPHAGYWTEPARH